MKKCFWFVIKKCEKLGVKGERSNNNRTTDHTGTSSKLSFKLQNKVIFVKNTHFSHASWCFLLNQLLLGYLLEPEMGVITVDQNNLPSSQSQNDRSVPIGLKLSNKFWWPFGYRTKKKK